MDFLSRDQQRQAVEELAEPTGEAPGAGGAESGGDRAAGGGRRLDRRSRRARRLPPGRPRAAPISRPTWPTSRAWASACAVCCSASRAGSLPGQHRGRHRWSWPAAPTPTPSSGRDAVRRRWWPRWWPCCRPATSTIAIAAARGRPPGRPAPAAASRLLEAACPDDGRTMVDRPDHAHQRARRRRAGRAHRGAGARQPRSAHPLRHPQRLRRHDRRATRPATPRCSNAPAPASRRSNAKYRRRARRPLLPLPPRRASGTQASRRGWAGSASAARSRSSTACCAAPPTPASRPRSASLDVLPSVRYCITLDSDTRLPRDAARRLIGIIAHPLNQPVSSTRRSAASPPATASCSRASA